MAGCSDKNFQSMLHAYELGMLADAERQELEMHLLDCPACRQSVLQFQEAINLIRQDKDIHDTIVILDQEDAEAAERDLAVSGAKARRRFWPSMVPATVAALAVIFLLVLKPWQIEFSPTQEAIAAKNRVAVMYFDNIPDPEDEQSLGRILTNLLITDLAESQYMQVVSNQRLLDILKLLKIEGIKKIDGQTATQIAQKANANWMLMGSILQVQPQLIVTAQLVDVETGNIVASQRITGQVNESIFSLIDELSAEIKSDLALPEDASQEVDRPIADVTTHSPEAYRLYLLGVSNYYKFYNDEATQNFTEALTYDSTIAMAYYYLAMIDQYTYIEQAVKYSEKAGYKEQLYIKSREMVIERNFPQAIAILKRLVTRYPDEKEAWYFMGAYAYSLRQYNESIMYLKKAIEIDPLYTAPYNQMAYTYSALNDSNRALEAINLYISLAPDEANPYDSRAALYASQGKFEEAIESYKMALQKKPDFRNSMAQLAILYTFQGNYADAEKYSHEVINSYDSLRRYSSRLMLAYIPQYQGKLDQTLTVLDDGIDLYLRDFGEERYTAYRHLKSVIYAEMKKWDLALAELEKCLQIESSIYQDTSGVYLDLYIQALAESGNLARAEQIADSFEVIVETSPQMLPDYLYARGALDFARGHYSDAVEYLEKSDSAASAFSLSTNYVLGRAYLAAGRPQMAAAVFQKLLDTISSWQLYWGIWTVKSHYYLGQAREMIGQSDEAIAHYEKFLRIWENSDPVFDEIKNEARQRIQKLRSKT